MNIAVITSGGDSPGMNPCVAQVVKEATAKGHKVYGYRNGFLGIRDNEYMELNVKDVQGWYKLGGTVLKTGRFPELKEQKWQRVLVENLKKNQIDALIVLGGDGSFNGALTLHKLDSSINIIGIPGTIDNNIYGSDYTLGFDTALNKQVTYIDDISDTGLSMPGRVFFVETLGAWDGYLTNSSVLMGMADFSVLVEKPMTNEEICMRVEELRRTSPKDYVLVTFAEGCYQTIEAAAYVKEKLDVNVKCNLIGFQQRGGVPTARDRIHAAGFAKRAVEAVDQGIMNKYVVYQEGTYGYLDIALASNKKEFDWFEL
ncbi:MAG: 6-phosphofructokinase [Lachnospiraceae bacterium]